MFHSFNDRHNFKYSVPYKFMFIHPKICANMWMLKPVSYGFLTTASFSFSFPDSACSRIFSTEFRLIPQEAYLCIYKFYNVHIYS